MSDVLTENNNTSTEIINTSTEITNNIIQKSIYKVLEKIVKDIDNDFDEKVTQNNNPCIQYAIIPEDIKNEFIGIIKKNGFELGNYSNISSNIAIKREVFKNTYKDLYFNYQTWLNNTFFKTKQITKFETDIALKVQYYDDNIFQPTGSSYFHREFVKENDTDMIEYGSTTNTHLILFYLSSINCKAMCGTVIKYQNKKGDIKKIILPAYDNLVYCIRDCCFVHKSPNSISVYDDKNEYSFIYRVLVRSYISLNDIYFEEPICPLIVPNPKYKYTTEGGKIKKSKKRKYIKHHNLRFRRKSKRKSRLIKRP